MMSRKNREIGQWGESAAAAYLVEKGYQLIGRNVHLAVGEIDLIALRPGTTGDILVFVEVKTRTSSSLGYPEEAFTNTKYRHVCAAVQSYLEAHPELECDWQIDLISVLGDRAAGDPQISHFERIVMPDERE